MGISKNYLPVVGLYLKAFLFAAVFYFFFTLITDQLFSNQVDLPGSLFKGLFFGVFMAVFLVSTHVFNLKKAGIKDLTKETLGVKQTSTAKSRLSLSQLTQSIKQDKYLGKSTILERPDEVLIKTRISWFGWGEKIRIQFVEHEGYHTIYNIESFPRLSTLLVDMGRNLKNVKRIQELLDEGRSNS